MWKYGDAGDRIQVRNGDIWKAGDHLFACGDLMEGAAERFFAFTGKQPDHSYTDPPYNQGLLRGFFTKAGLQTERTFPEFLDALLTAMRHIQGSLFIEIGYQERPRLLAALEYHKARILADWSITYDHKYPARLIHATFGSMTFQPLLLYFTDGIDDSQAPHDLMLTATQPGEIVMDFCIGRGLTAVSAHKTGRIAWGIELHPRRLAVTLEKLQPFYAIEKVGVLR